MRLARLSKALKFYTPIGDDIILPKDTTVKITNVIKSESGEVTVFDVYCGSCAVRCYTSYDELPFEYIE